MGYSNPVSSEDLGRTGKHPQKNLRCVGRDVSGYVRLQLLRMSNENVAQVRDAVKIVGVVIIEGHLEQRPINRTVRL